MADILETYKKEMTWHGNHDAVRSPISRFFNGFRIEIPSDTGKGWNETLEIDSGLCLSLSDYRLDKPINNKLHLAHSPLRFNILLNGALDFRLDSITRHTVLPGDIWVWNDLTGDILRTMHPAHEMCGVTLTFPQHLIEAWLGDTSCDASKNLEKLISFTSPRQGKTARPIFPLTRQLPQTSQIMCMAKNLFRSRGIYLFRARRTGTSRKYFCCAYKIERQHICRYCRTRAVCLGAGRNRPG